MDGKEQGVSVMRNVLCQTGAPGCGLWLEGPQRRHFPRSNISPPVASQSMADSQHMPFELSSVAVMQKNNFHV